MKETQKLKFYEQSWFIMLMLFTPLFPIGMYLMWRSKGIHVVFKVFFTFVYIYAIFFTLQTQTIPFLEDKQTNQVQNIQQEKQVETTTP